MQAFAIPLFGSSMAFYCFRFATLNNNPWLLPTTGARLSICYAIGLFFQEVRFIGTFAIDSLMLKALVGITLFLLIHKFFIMSRTALENCDAYQHGEYYERLTPVLSIII